MARRRTPHDHDLLHIFNAGHVAPEAQAFAVAAHRGLVEGEAMSRAVVQIKSELDRRKIATWAGNVPINTTVEFRAPRRSNDQNSLMWSLLSQISKQVDWYGTKLSSEDWKDVLTASLRRTRVVPGIDAGTFVPLGMRTSQMTKAELAELIELIYAFGAERSVQFRELEVIA